MDPESVAVTAGLGGFVSFFLLALALYLLMRNMNSRMRRMAYREEQEAKLAAGGSASGRQDSSGPESGTTKSPDVV